MLVPVRDNLDRGCDYVLPAQGYCLLIDGYEAVMEW